jgi:3-hydroxyacyl-[acyl-carrier-protein] dehydratase
MKLINDFFEISAIESQSDAIRCKVKLNPEHFIYKAHFPGNPVTPGVCLVQMATEILSQEYHKDLMLDVLKNIKFKKIVSPDDEPVFVFTKVTDEETEQQLSASISIEDDEEQFAKLSVVYHYTNV